MKKISAAAFALIVAGFGFAGPASAGDAMEKCVADTTALGSPDPEGQCACFLEAISDDAAVAYAGISDWESEASDEMKEAGVACFPELN